MPSSTTRHLPTRWGSDMPVLDIDIWRSARVLVGQHGPDAPTHAAMRADAMLETGDLEGYAVWRRILRAMEELRREVPGPGSSAALH